MAAIVSDTLPHHCLAYKQQRLYWFEHMAGYALIELMIVTLIIGIVGQFVAYNLSKRTPQQRLHGAAQQLAWDLTAARMQAIKSSKNVIIDFLNDKEYIIGIDVNNNLILDDNEGKIKNIQNNYYLITFSTPLPSAFFFYPGGNINTPISIALENISGSKNVLITSIGKVKIN